MLLSHGISFFHLPTKPSLEKYINKTNNSFLSNHSITNSFCNNKNSKKYSSFPFRRHRPTAELTAAADETRDANEGIGIFEFFKGKNIFITGATGFIGKVVVEKILRSTSVGKMYLLIKAKDKEAAFDRLNCEIINSELFKSLKQEIGDSYEAFVREKLIPIVGDICNPNLGMDYESIEVIRKDVNVIIHSAASTAFDERYDLLVDANVIASERVMRFAKTCNKIHLFTHISTAYVSGRREGTIMEKPLVMGGDDVALDVADEISFLLKSSPNYDDATKFYRNLGQERAEMLGWNNPYQISKAMGEMVLNEIRGNIPLLIIRPATVESCFREPVPGWIQGLRMLDPVILSYGKGLVAAYNGNPQAHIDLVPVDLVVNTTIAAIAKQGTTHMPQPIVYHVAPSLSNQFTFFEFFECLNEYFERTPLFEGARVAKVNCFENFDEFSKYIREEFLRKSKVGDDRKKVRECNLKAAYIERISKIYKFATFHKARFHTGNTQKLIEEMSKEEEINFELDTKNINWKMYLQEIHIPGLIKYVLHNSNI